MYTPESSAIYDVANSFIDYKAAAESVRSLIAQRNPSALTLLDVGCGTGQHLEHFAAHYSVAGLDLNPAMLAEARRRLPDAPLHVGDLADFEVPQRFDVITCLFSSIAYAETADRLASAMRSMVRHLNPSGLLIVEPWFEPHHYWSDTITANHAEQGDHKVCWMYTSKRDGDVSVLDIHYLSGTPHGVEHFSEEHRLGLFTRAQYEGAMRACGLRVEHDPEGPFHRGRGLYIGQAANT